MSKWEQRDPRLTHKERQRARQRQQEPAERTEEPTTRGRASVAKNDIPALPVGFDGLQVTVAEEWSNAKDRSPRHNRARHKGDGGLFGFDERNDGTTQNQKARRSRKSPEEVAKSYETDEPFELDVPTKGEERNGNGGTTKRRAGRSRRRRRRRRRRDRTPKKKVTN